MNETLLQALSALADGRATAQDWQQIEAAWDQHPELSESWLAWHALGDALRSADLRPAALAPDALLARLHAGMDAPAITPVAAPAAPLPRRRVWLPPLAVAASFVALAVGLGALRGGLSSGEPLATAPPWVEPAAVGSSFAQTVVALPAAGPGQPAMRGDTPLWPDPIMPAASAPYP